MKSLKTWSKRLAALGMSLVLTATILVPARADSNAIGASDEMTNTTSQENQGGDIITSVNFENANQEGKYTLVKSENTLEVRQENGNHFLYLERTGNINNTFFHLNIETSEQSSMKEKGGYVFEYDLRINELKPCGAIEICTAKNAAGEWLQLGYIYEDGSIKIDGVSMGSFPIDGEWHRLSIAFDYDTKTATCYVDRTKQVGEVTIADNYLPAFYRVGAEKNGDDISQSDATFSVDNCRIYQDTILRTAEQDAAEGDEEPTKGGDVIKKVTFSVESAYWINDKDNLVEVRTDADENKYLHLERTKNNFDSYVDFNLSAAEIEKIREKNGFVLDFDLTLDQNEGQVDFFSSKDADGSWGTWGFIDGGGTISYLGTTFGTITMKEKHRISLVFDAENGAVKCYVDGTRLGGAALFDKTFVPAMFRMGATTDYGAEQKDVVFELDNVRLYQGTVLRTAEQDAAEGDEEPTKGGDVILSLDFEDESQSSQYALINNGGCTMELRTEDENSFVYLERRNSAINSFFQAKLPESVQSKMTEKNGYVLEYDLRVGELSASAAVEICTAKDTGGNWLPVGYLRSDGTITFDGISLGTFPIDGEWHRLSLVFDYKTGTVVCYVDRVRDVYKRQVAKFALGQESLDGFDAFVEKVKGMGLEHVLEVKQAGYDRYLAR